MKLRRLAQELIDDFRAVRDQGITARSPFDRLLLGRPVLVDGDGAEAAPPAAN